MDSNNNSNEASEEQNVSIKAEPNPNSEGEGQSYKEDRFIDRLELSAPYDASDDMPDQESGTQTPIEDEPHGSEETEDSQNQVVANIDNNINQDPTNNDSSLTKAGVIRVQESEEDGSESIEIELEDDNSLLLTSLTSLFPEATGLKYRHPGTNTLRGVKLADGKFIEPLDGWSAVQNYICVSNRGSKRKNDDDDEVSRKAARTDSDKPMGDGSDLVVLGLPWTTTEETMRTYFEQYGEVSMVQVKTDKNGKSRGFGFVRFAKSSIQNKLLSMRHFIDGRWCDVRVPLSKAESDATKAAQLSRKIFVGRLPDNITTDDLRTHFSEYGTLTDVFIPKPFRNFAFVTFGTSDMAQSIFKHKHTIKGSQIQISEAIPRDNGPSSYGSGGSFSGGQQQGTTNSYAPGYGTTNSNIHPFNNNYGAHQAQHHYHNNKSNFGGNMYGQNNRSKMHQQSTYYQMPAYGGSGPSGGLDSASYVNHNAHGGGEYASFGSVGAYGQPASGANGGQYYKMPQQQQQQQQPQAQPAMTPQQNHSAYPNQAYSSHGTTFSRSSYGVWK